MIFRSEGMLYRDFLPRLQVLRGARKYLEIGVQNGQNLRSMQAVEAYAIDPNYKINCDPTSGKNILHLYQMTSDVFFEKYSPSDIDLAFLDGMHLFEYLLRDFYNTEKCCCDNGLITLHDCLPVDGHMISREETIIGGWTGDIWKVIPILEKYRPDLKVVCLDCLPTGLVCVTNLDPTSTVLRDSYLKIVEEFRGIPNTEEELHKFYDNREVLSAAAILNGFDHSLYFKV